MYGGDVNLEKFRPTGDKYSASKIHESLLKIHISTFCKRIEETYHLEQNMKKKKAKNNNINNSSNSINRLDTPKSINTTNNYLLSSSTSSSQASSQQNSIIQNEEIYKGLASDSSSTFSNIKANSIKYIKIVIGFLFLFTFILILIEFLITYRHMGKLTKKLVFLRDSYIINNDIAYAKFYVTEGVIGNVNPDYICKKRTLI
jgi:hypothetical protein